MHLVFARTTPPFRGLVTGSSKPYVCRGESGKTHPGELSLVGLMGVLWGLKRPPLRVNQPQVASTSLRLTHAGHSRSRPERGPCDWRLLARCQHWNFPIDDNIGIASDITIYHMESPDNKVWVCIYHCTQNDYRTELYYLRIIFGNSCSVITEPICFWNWWVSVSSVSTGLPNPLPNCCGNYVR